MLTKGKYYRITWQGELFLFYLKEVIPSGYLVHEYNVTNGQIQFNQKMDRHSPFDNCASQINDDYGGLERLKQAIKDFNEGIGVSDLKIEFISVAIRSEISKRTGFDYNTVEVIINCLQDIKEEQDTNRKLAESIDKIGLTPEQIKFIKEHK